MEKYIAHIEELVYLHDCVVIPEFGAFIARYNSAVEAAARGILLPPSKTLLFNKQLRQDDGLLASRVAREESIDHRKARARIARFRETLTARLERRERVTFGAIGAFHLDAKHHLVFEPTGHNFLTDTRGMYPVPLRRRETASTPHPGANILARLFKYGLSAAVITGIIAISQSDIFRPDTRAGNAAMHPGTTPATVTTPRPPVISPSRDFVNYTPDW